MASLDAMDADVEHALENINVPSYVIDDTGIIRWTNPSAQRIVGDVVGRQFTSVVAPEEVLRARETFARKVTGNARSTDHHDVVLIDEDGERVQVDICSVPLYRGGRVVGVFGQVRNEGEPETQPHPHLTPRQAEILRLLEHGRSTRQIAEELHLSLETVRNHVRHLLRALGAHSRLEAVAMARQSHALTA
jgi:PAS domain S-box-containing protein